MFPVLTHYCWVFFFFSSFCSRIVNIILKITFDKTHGEPDIIFFMDNKAELCMKYGNLFFIRYLKEKKIIK